MLVLRLFLKDKGGGKQQCLIPFVGSNLGVETFFKKMEHQKRVCCNRGLRHLGILCIEVSIKLCQASLPFNCFLVIKGILKCLYFFIPWLLNFSNLPNYGSNSRKRYTLRLLLKRLVRSTLHPVGDKVTPTLQYTLWFP